MGMLQFKEVMGLCLKVTSLVRVGTRKEIACLLALAPTFFAWSLWPRWPTNQDIFKENFKYDLWSFLILTPTTDDEWFQISQPFSDWIQIFFVDCVTKWHYTGHFRCLTTPLELNIPNFMWKDVIMNHQRNAN